MTFFKSCLHLPSRPTLALTASQSLSSQLPSIASTRLTTRSLLFANKIRRQSMATVKDDIPHVVRTAADSRQRELFNARISRIELVNRNIRLFRFSLDRNGPPLRHLPGQYIDLYIPNIDTVGGFTITSPPQTAILQPVSPASSSSSTTNPNTDENQSDLPYIELAIQKSTTNPPAAHLYLPPPDLLNQTISLRVGGNFTHPPPTFTSRAEFEAIENIVLIAGGVGINPIMSMISAMDLASSPPSSPSSSLSPGSSSSSSRGGNKAAKRRLGGMTQRVRVLYSSKREYDPETGQGEEILFERRLDAIAKKWTRLHHNGQDDDDGTSIDFKYTFFETGEKARREGKGERISEEDLLEAVGTVEERRKALVYVCGHPGMTDRFVEFLRGMDGLDERRVLCEKWW